MAAIRQTFFQECEEQLAELETGLLSIESGDSDHDTVNAVFRAVHSIKGGAGAFGLDELVRFAHTFETALDLVRSGRIEADAALVRLMLRSSDTLADLVRVSRDGGAMDDQRVAHLHDELTRIADPDAATAAPAVSAPEASVDQTANAGEAGDDDGFVPLQVSFDGLLGGDADAEPVAADSIFRIWFRPKPELYAKANDAAKILREICSLGEADIACDVSAVPVLAELDPEGAYLSWTIRLVTGLGEDAVREVFEFVEFDCEFTVEQEMPADPVFDFEPEPVAAVLDQAASLAEGEAEAPAIPQKVMDRIAEVAVKDAAPAKPAAGGQSAQAQASQTIRVDLDRVDRLIDLVGELVINQSMLTQRVTEAGIARLSEVAVGLDDLEQLTREIQDSVMAIRAQPVRPIFQRMSRVVREVAEMTGKSVRLVTEGEACEVDKTVIERLADPLTHMIRNAIDHGLETPEERVETGKPEQGSVRLTAAHRSGRVVIEVADDGAGINRQRVLEKAVANGLVDPNAQLSDGEIDDLIFHPGFSTAGSVSDVSGRGVGMDVVKSSIQALGGRISIASQPGAGSTFTMSLPLTLAVLDGMVVNVAGQTLVVPLTAIVETLQPKEADVHGLGETSRVVSMRGAFLPLIDVGHELGYREAETDPLDGVAIMVETENRAQSVLLVDSIVGQQQVVIKSLEANYGHVFGVAAATILGDGQVAVIVDVDAVVAGRRAEPDLANRKRTAA
ncbi:chemotaxis protein CheA [Mesorhizobium xinjiangense]|uniref:chemotaxis protein CheA n=1 Tax=Mesorhizobium xinjiangense TaxID=2678685 RepID=UPI0012ED6B3C|nr:chemotaxis protein CheA [Mesorhizobium xinjiangense]